jgi:hypothetical protein
MSVSACPGVSADSRLRHAVSLRDGSRISHRFDGVEARLDNELDVPSGQSGDTLCLTSQTLFFALARCVYLESGQWRWCSWSACPTIVMAQLRTLGLFGAHRDIQTRYQVRVMGSLRLGREGKLFRRWRGWVCVQGTNLEREPTRQLSTVSREAMTR